MVKLTTLCEAYLQEKRNELAWATRDNTERAFRLLALAVGDLLVDAVKYDHIARYKNWLVDGGRSRTTANIYLRCLNPVFAWAVLKGTIKLSPTMEVTQYRVTPKPVRVYDENQFIRMMRYVPKPSKKDPQADIRWKAILLLARTCGLRRGEIFNLTRDNLRDGFVFVEPKSEGHYTFRWDPKVYKVRRIPLVDYLKDMLDTLACFYPAVPLRRYHHLLEMRSQRLLTERVRRDMVENVRRDFVRIHIRAFGRQIGDFHQLRKTAITGWAENLPSHVTQTLAGHSDVRTTVTYYTQVTKPMYEQARKVALEVIKGGSSLIAGTPYTQHASRGETI